MARRVKPLPDDLVARAFHARNGELAWTRQDAAQAAEALASAGMAIRAGEVWLVTDDGGWDPRIPTEDGDSGAVHSWAPDPPDRQGGESWAQFCMRTLDYTAVVLGTAEVEALAPVPLRGRIRYHLTWSSEETYLRVT